MALVSYIGLDRNISQISLFVTVYIAKISTVEYVQEIVKLNQIESIQIECTLKF